MEFVNGFVRLPLQRMSLIFPGGKKLANAQNGNRNPDYSRTGLHWLAVGELQGEESEIWI